MGIRADLYKAYAQEKGKAKAFSFLMKLIGHDADEATDEDVWRTTEEGKHFKFDNSTGEIKAGFGGKLNGKKLGKTFTHKENKATAGSAPANPIRKNSVFESLASNAKGSEGYSDFKSDLTSAQQKAISDQREATGTTESLEDYTERLRKMLCAEPRAAASKNRVVQGKDISKTYSWENKSYTNPENGQVIDTPIEDVIHKQGFDGVPKVVSQQEFDDIVKGWPNSPILFRAYTAPNQETLAAYDEMLEDGQWYVDCGVGGAQYGQGMYCAGCYNFDVKRFDKLKDDDLVISGVLFSDKNGKTYQTVRSEKLVEESGDMTVDTPYLIGNPEDGNMRLVQLSGETYEPVDVETGELIPEDEINAILVNPKSEIWQCKNLPEYSRDRESRIEGAKREMGDYLELGMHRAFGNYKDSGVFEAPEGKSIVACGTPIRNLSFGDDIEEQSHAFYFDRKN